MIKVGDEKFTPFPLAETRFSAKKVGQNPPNQPKTQPSSIVHFLSLNSNKQIELKL